MRKIRVLITVGCCLLAVTIAASAQAIRKPGLWEMTSNMTWQKSPLPPGVTMPPGMKSPFSGSTITTQVCLTQAMIDKYGAPVSQSKDCKIINISMHATGMTANMVCNGRMSGKGEIESSWAFGGVTKGKVHFAGAMQSGQQSTPVEWTVNSTSTYQGPDCGSVKPMPSN